MAETDHFVDLLVVLALVSVYCTLLPSLPRATHKDVDRVFAHVLEVV